jgi:peptidoglycan/xylan/chitin deacetylase (PgdA/CDA1 family)
METFESTVKEIVQSGAEIGLHGYAHEGAYQMTEEQEREVLVKCMEVAQRLTGKKVQGYRAPMYQLRETTIELLKEFGFLYDSSLSHHDSQPYFVPCAPPVQRIDFSKPASSWLRPTELADMESLMAGKPLVEIPTGWNNEDMMALQYFPHLHNSHGHVDARVVEQRWKDIFLWLWENPDLEDGSFVFPLLMHPDTSGMAHVAGMVDRFIGWLRGWGDTVQFHTFSSIAQSWLDEKMKRQD